MTDYKGVIFDFNGTLFFDNDKHILAWNAISKELRKREITEEELYDKFNGTPNDQIIRYMTDGKASLEEIKKYSLLKEEYYRKFCQEDKANFHLVKGVEEYFNYLKERKIPFTIASASIKENIDFFVESFDLEKWMDVSNIVYDDGTYENKVQMFHDASQKIGVSMKDILIIEDSVSGMKSADLAGCSKILVVCDENMESSYKKFPGVIGTMRNFEHILDSL